MAGRGAVPSEQRVFSLVLALVVSPEGLTKRELLSSVYGYAERFSRDAASTALDRQFERDKEQLRGLGIHIETLDSPLEPGNNQLTRYRISKELLEFPPELRFSERELVLLRLAALAWQEGSLSAESRRAAMKLEALGAGLDLQHLGVAPRLGSAEPAAAALQEAIDAGRVVRFAYTLPGRDAPLERRVAPLRLHRVDGRWHLISWDLDRAAERVFLLARMSGTVVVEQTRFDPALRELAEPAVAGLLRLREQQRATLRVGRGTVAEARLTPRATAATAAAPQDDAVELTLGMLDPHLLAQELMGYGAEVAVLAPESLRELVVGGLRRIAAAHEEAPHG
ncbi:helix-turn-helix transcriptional regulator [Leucobacter chromiireducens]|uniref:helix-turn-helix transcriptional regulator n=1 Tax=Leucobacter chromiireducens TaxID=283877 RepID=UPI000F638E7E|nr:WYL domain-containing protein [Leucobacter chromiireducens]